MCESWLGSPGFCTADLHLFEVTTPPPRLDRPLLPPPSRPRHPPSGPTLVGVVRLLRGPVTVGTPHRCPPCLRPGLRYTVALATPVHPALLHTNPTPSVSSKGPFPRTRSGSPTPSKADGEEVSPERSGQGSHCQVRTLTFVSIWFLCLGVCRVSGARDHPPPPSPLSPHDCFCPIHRVDRGSEVRETSEPR